MLTPQATWQIQGSDPTPQPASSRGPILLLTMTLGIVLLVYVYSLVRTAWLGDDAYITFRTIENFLAGYGLTWNTDERVQTYTHPLWMFLLAGLRAVSGEIYYTSLFASMALALAAVLLIVRIARTWGQALLAAAVCTFSKAFVDYSTSGLENPLSYLLVAWFLWLYLGRETGTIADSAGMAAGAPADELPVAAGEHRSTPASANRSRLLGLSLLASLILLTRMDLALLIGPALLHAFWQSRGLRAVGTVFLGLLPFLAWEVFSVIYYGFPFPNTAYAKLNTGIGIAELAPRGLAYLSDSLCNDPLTLAAIVAALVAGAVVRSRHGILAIGIVLYLLYIIRIGGDFMSGRFLAVLVLAAAAQLATLPVRLSAAGWLSAALLAVCLGLLAPRPPVLTSNLHGLAWSWNVDANHIVDERAYYYPQTGLLHDRLGIPSPTERLKQTALALGQHGRRVVAFPTAGLFGYYAGPNVHVIDYYALADPLLARLPMAYSPNWRIGHFTRHVPDGYLEKIESEGNRLSDPRLDAFDEKIRLITRGPIFSRQRWRVILDMNLGRCDSLIDCEFYRNPPRRVWLSQVSGGPLPSNVRELPRRPDGALDLPVNGFLVTFDSVVHATALEINIDADRAYCIDYPQPGRFPVCQEIAAASSQPGRITRRIDVPPQVASQGYNRLRIYPVGPGSHTLGFLRPIMHDGTNSSDRSRTGQ